MDFKTRAFAAQPQSKLLILPAELRIDIYELVLRLPVSADSNGGTIISHGIQDEESMQPRSSLSVLNLLLVCGQIYSEAETLFYSLNHLRYEVMDPFRLFAGQKNGPFIHSLSARRRRALSAVTLNARYEYLALLELKETLLPLATNLHTLYVALPLQAWSSDGGAMAWAREVQVMLRTTKVRVVRMVHSDRQELLADLNTGGSGNNSYVFISHRAKLERARELNQKIEEMLRGIVED